jgi:transposase
VLDGAVKAPDLLRFLARLVRDATRKAFLILDRLPVHRSAKLRAWLAGREAEIEVFHLPGYSPELNPDESINGDLKQAVTRKAPARSKAQLQRAVVGHMRKLSKLPHRVRSLFGHKTFRYAAWFKLAQAGSITILRRCRARARRRAGTVCLRSGDRYRRGHWPFALAARLHGIFDGPTGSPSS